MLVFADFNTVTIMKNNMFPIMINKLCFTILLNRVFTIYSIHYFAARHTEAGTDWERAFKCFVYRFSFPFFSLLIHLTKMIGKIVLHLLSIEILGSFWDGM